MTGFFSDVYSAGIRECRMEFETQYGNCMDKIKIVGYLFCWPFKLSVICNLMKGQCNNKDYEISYSSPCIISCYI